MRRVRRGRSRHAGPGPRSTARPHAVPGRARRPLRDGHRSARPRPPRRPHHRDRVRAVPPHRPGRPALEPIVAVEGGPGYATRASRDSYLDLFDPLMDRRDLIIVDNRGTGALRRDQLRDSCRATSATRRERRSRAAAARRRRRRLRDRERGRRHDRGARLAQRQEDQPLRRLLRHVLRPDLRGPAPRADPLGDSTRRTRSKAAIPGTETRPARCATPSDSLLARPACAARRRPDRADGTDGRTAPADPITGRATDADGAMQNVTIDAAGSRISRAPGPGAPRSTASSIRRSVPRSGDPGRRSAAPPRAPRTSGSDAGTRSISRKGLYAAVICHDYPQLWDPT